LIRLLLDQGLPRSTGALLAEAGWDVAHVGDIDMARATDSDILAYARRENRVCLITSVNIWLEMRDLRNRIVHQYLPEQLTGFYALITGPFKAELTRLKICLEATKQR